MKSYAKNAVGQSFLDREIGLLLTFERPIDVLQLLAGPIGEAIAKRWARAIRRIHFRDVERECVRFQPEPVHKPNAELVRRFVGLMCIVLQESGAHPKGGYRAFTPNLWRGRAQREVVSPDGEFRQVYVPVESQGGLAARLGCSVRMVDYLLRVARAAGFLTVRQVKAKRKVDKLPRHLRGRKYSYAIFYWAMELPRALWDRVRGAKKPEIPRAELASAPPRRESAASGAFFEKLEQWGLEPSRPPS